MRHKFLAFLVAMLLALPAPTPAQAEVPPPEVATQLPAANLHGQGVLGFLWFEAYRAALWAPGPWSYEEPFALSITYKMNFTAAELIDRTIIEMQRVHAATEAEAMRPFLQKALPPVAKGDRLTALYTPPATTAFYKNGTLIATVTDANFASMFFNIWLGAETSEPELRRSLLALSE